jgi:hypothetical protein
VLLVLGDRDIAQELLEAASAHPSILYEYGIRASGLLNHLGVEAPEGKDELVLIDVIEGRFDLEAPEG